MKKSNKMVVTFKSRFTAGVKNRLIFGASICLLFTGALFSQEKVAAPAKVNPAEKAAVAPPAEVKAEVKNKEKPADEVPEDVFYTQLRLVNLPTDRNLRKNDLYVNFMHRFKANISDDEQRKPVDMFGLDWGSVLALEFAYGITDWFMVGVQRTSVNKNLELYGEVSLLKEFSQGEFDLKRQNPFSLSFRAGAATGIRENIDDNWSGNFQVIAGRDLFGGYLHLYVVPSVTTVAHYAADRSARVVGVVGVGAYVAPLGKTSGFRLTGEYNLPFRKFEEYKNTWGFGINIVTGDHTFGIILANTLGTSLDLNAQAGLTNEMHLGFNLTRTFSLFTPKANEK